ncbi:right-handed parallel beta-helix repeat-containing protein [Clavibacter sp. VKM Ac-2873]|uniref:right-handed parallel beta-helix repeat-containing protein n=1 Tax=Clavibacter sp. VKM Ac-2873 TaxID=2783813 RepID=UPI00188A334A|nr:right-handed parallel beta-helix repeat-containing protein [Clavibacter sp. VKM Ac-2873]MBF4617501.1 right-handed parallel beta-helix repeat-containing protein [Clavibacter sp. VKM Ac-2873]
MRHRTPSPRSTPRRPARHVAPASRPARGRPLIALAVAVGLAVPAALVAPQTAGAATGQDLTAGSPVFSDSFTRTATGGWGAAAGAAAYAYDGAAFRANGAQGVVDLARAGSAASVTVPVSAPSDSEATVRVMVPRVPSQGNGVSAGLQQRATGSTYYQSTVRVDATGTAYLSVVRVNGSTAAQTTLVGATVVARGVVPGRVLSLQTRTSGTASVAVDARAWLEGQAVPAWQAAAVDSSAARIASGTGVRVWSYLSKTSGPQALAFDDLAVRPLSASAAPVTPTPAPTAPAPAPTPAPAPATDAGDAEQAVALGDARPGAGAAAIGSTRYAVPANAVFVAPTGANGAAGTQAAPLASIQRAVDVAPSGRTIVVRAGSYHESVTIPKGKALTIQPYPGEAVWLDGSRKVTSWVAAGSAWYAPGWDIAFDTSPTYTRGAPDGTGEGWRFVDPAYPLAAHPDQVWFGAGAQKQVASRSAVVPGTFFVDTAADRLYVGSDPRSASVRSSDLVTGLVIRGEGSTVRGIGIRRYAPSVPDQGTVQVHAPKVTIEDVAITDNATAGLSIAATDAKVTAVTVARNGMLGMRAVYADRLVATRLLVADNNTERFNRAPVSGGFKVGRSRTVQVTDSAFLRNVGNGLWFDESVYDGRVVGNDVIGGTGRGIVLELSAEFLVADNVIARNAMDGLLISDTGHVDVWNNTLAGNARDINIAQGDRRASDLSTAGHDPRQKLPDPTVTWIVTDVVISNNVLQGSTGNALLAVEDHSHQRSATQMGIRVSGNVYQRDRATSPKWAIVWARGPGDPAVYDTVRDFAAATGNDRGSVEVTGRAVLGSGFRLTSEIASLQATVAVGVPALVGSLLGLGTGARALGATSR